MDYNEFIALNRGLRGIPAKKNPGTRFGVGTDACAIHGRYGAQVALLQSPILRTAPSPYIEKETFRGPPVDKPHTRSSAVKNGCLRVSASLRLKIPALPSFSSRTSVEKNPCSVFIRVHPCLSVFGNREDVGPTSDFWTAPHKLMTH